MAGKSCNSPPLLCCEMCGSQDDFESGGDGFLYCRQCGAQNPDIVHTAASVEDVLGFYSFRHRRRPAASLQPAPFDNFFDNDDDNNYRGSNSSKGKEKEKEMNLPLPSFLLDFATTTMRSRGECPLDPDTLVELIRSRYVEGLQVLIQLQLETLVRKFNVSPIICEIVGPVWLRYVTVSRVFDSDWAHKAIVDSEVAAAARGAQQDKPVKAKYRSEPNYMFGRRAIYIWLSSLRKTIPLYCSLAISFLACHIAREAILPTDIIKWAGEGELPYIAAFLEIDKRLGNYSSSCLLSARQLFKASQVVGAEQLEVMAASIAQSVGLSLPSVNFNAIAQRYLQELSLPVEKLLPHACRLYMWSYPAELWLSSDVCSIPTRVCVMSIVVVIMRVLYTIHGQGVWERSLASLNEENDVQSSEFNTVKLLHNLQDIYAEINNTPDYLRDLSSYLRYCDDVVFAGTITSRMEEKLIDSLRKFYEEEEEGRSSSCDMKSKRPRIAGHGYADTSSATQRKASMDVANYVMRKMKVDMEEDGFIYLPPRTKLKNKNYLQYNKKNVDRQLKYAAHADYYIILRACARLLHVDVNTLHRGVLILEKKLLEIEKQFDSIHG